MKNLPHRPWQRNQPLNQPRPKPRNLCCCGNSRLSSPLQAVGPGGLTLHSVLSNWARIRAAIKKGRSQTEGLLNSCKPISLKEGMLTLGFASELLKGKMETRENIDITRQVIEQVCGASVQITCVVLGVKTGCLLQRFRLGG